MSISLLVKKVIAGILAILMPISATVTGSLQRYAVTPQTEARRELDAYYMENYVQENTEEDTYDYGDEYGPELKEVEDGDEEETPDAPEVPETPAAEEENDVNIAGEEMAQANAAPVAEWDISDTDEDDVKMYYYDSDDVSFIDAITASVKALFVPITAYAAENVDCTEDRDVDGTVYAKGTVVIKGSGATEKFLFLNWLDYDLFVRDYEAWCADNGYADEVYILRENICDDGTFNGRGLPATAIDEYDTYAEAFDDYIPMQIAEFIYAVDNFWGTYADFVPTAVVIKGDVLEINICAFAFCTEIKEVTIDANVGAIHAGAFAHTGISTITLPASLEVLGASAFVNCENLRTVYVNSDVDSLGDNIFTDLPDGATVYCATIRGYKNFANIDPDAPTLEDYEDGAETQYNKTTKIVFEGFKD